MSTSAVYPNLMLVTVLSDQLERGDDAFEGTAMPIEVDATADSQDTE